MKENRIVFNKDKVDKYYEEYTERTRAEGS